MDSMNYGKLTPNGGLVFAPRGKGRGNDHESLISKGYLPVVYTDAPQIEGNYRVYTHWENTGTSIIQEWEVVFDEHTLSDEGQYLLDKIDELTKNVEQLTFNLNKISETVTEVIKKDDKEMPEGDYVHPIPFVDGMSVEQGKFYVFDDDNIWECIKSGNGAEYTAEWFEIIE